MGDRILHKVLDFENKRNCGVTNIYLQKLKAGELSKSLIDTYNGINSKHHKKEVYKVLSSYTFGETLKIFFRLSLKEQKEILRVADKRIYYKLKHANINNG